jgi:hypothetical protein
MTIMRRRFAFLPTLFIVLLTSSTPLITACGEGDSTGPSKTCCRVCKEGKPCGDTCIARTSTCRTSGGCACQG